MPIEYDDGRDDPKRASGVWLLVDRNAYDVLVETPEIQRIAIDAHESGRVTFVMTHVQNDEMLLNPNEEQRNAIAAIPFVHALTYGVVLGTSKLGLARFGESEKIEAIRSPSGNHTNDALLATTAEHEGTILVTNDKRLRNFASRNGVEVWSPKRLVEFLTG